MTSYQPIREQYFLIRSVPTLQPHSEHSQGGSVGSGSGSVTTGGSVSSQHDSLTTLNWNTWGVKGGPPFTPHVLGGGRHRV